MNKSTTRALVSQGFFSIGVNRLTQLIMPTTSIGRQVALVLTMIGMVSLVFGWPYACTGFGTENSGIDSNGDTESKVDSDSNEDTDFQTDYECNSFDISVSLSTKIGTVGIVEWSYGKGPVKNAHIEFGLDTDYGMEAPVDLNEPGYRTLLLGMKPSREYHFKIVADDGKSSFESCDVELTTGPVPNGLPIVNVSTFDTGKVDSGYTLSVLFLTGWIFILDADGDYVWWFPAGHTEISRARMSYNGKYMLVRNVNVIRETSFAIKISMDGLEKENIDMKGGHHDFTVLPDDTIAYIKYDDEICDDVVELYPDGTSKRVFHLANIITPPPIKKGMTDGCHSNALTYSQSDDSYTISVLNKNQIIKFGRDGEMRWILGGDENTFNGDDLTWYKQHGHQLYESNILFFNNNTRKSNSYAFIYSLDEQKGSAKKVFQYSSKGRRSITFGDVQHLSNGNILVTFSNQAVIHEINADGDLLRKIRFEQEEGGLGYVTRQQSLYGPP